MALTLPATDNRRGAWLLIAAALAFTLEVTLVRFAAVEANQTQIVCFRSLAQLVVALLWVGMTSTALIRTKRLGLHILRGLVSLSTWALYYASFQALDLALATSLTFTSSLFVVLLASPLLGEHVGRGRLGCALLGFGGVVIATGVGSVAFDPATLLGLAAAAIMALLVILNRLLARSEPVVTIMFYIGVVTVVGTAPVAAWHWQPLSGTGFVLITLTGSLGALGMWLTLEAYRFAEVSALAPYPYLRIVFAVALGWLVFGELLDLRTLIGTLVIVASVVLAGRWERQRLRKDTAHQPCSREPG